MCLDRVLTHCALNDAPNVGVNFPMSHEEHVLGLEAPFTVLYVETGQKMHVSNEVAPIVVLYIPRSHDTHTDLSNEEYVPGMHVLI